MGKYKYSRSNRKIYVAILWHMHQPWYSEANSNECIMPWVRLHALKDYYDMPLWLSKVPEMKATFNLVPSLLKQIEGYASGEMTDKYQTMFRLRPSEMTPDDKKFIVKNFFAANHENFIATSPRYLLLSRKKNQGAEAFSDQELLDLQMHFEMAWFGESMKRTPEIRRFIRKDMGFDQSDKKILIEMENERLKSIIPFYKKIAESGNVELTTTPFYHPILPILCNFKNILKSDPTSPMPKDNFSYPEDAREQIERGINYFKELTGVKPRGMWPSEGSVAEDIVPLLADAGIEWIATDEEILWRSRGKTSQTQSLFSPYSIEVNGKAVNMFFRDHKLSDKIGFAYSKWKAEDAAKDFIANIRGILDIMPYSNVPSIVPIILDGENAWEYFPDNGYKFLTLLYDGLVDAPDIEPITFSEYLDLKPEVKHLKQLTPGSWIMGNFRTWSGDKEKNKGWDLVAKTRKILENSNLEKEKWDKAFEHMMIAEGSDWFWWYGEGNYTPYLDEFDRVFRSHLRAAIAECENNDFPELEEVVFNTQPIIEFHRKPVDLVSPFIDGRETSFYEWASAGTFIPRSFRGTMHGEGAQSLSKLFVGFDLKNLYIRIDGKKNMRKEIFRNDFDIKIKFTKPQDMSIVIKSDYSIEYFDDTKAFAPKENVPETEIREVIELAVPFEFLQAKEKNNVHFAIEVFRKGVLIETIPAGGLFLVEVPDESYELDMWYV